MVIMELFGMNGSGKTTTILELEKRCEIELPVTVIEKYSYLRRNSCKALKVLAVVFNDLPFSFRLLIMMWRKHRWTWDTIATWFNICHRGYFYLFKKDRKIVLGGGMLHKVWGTYGLVPITERDRKEIVSILSHFQCKGGYYLDVPKDVILARNTNRGRNTFLEQRLDELDFLYENYYAFIDAIRDQVKVRAVKPQKLEDRVWFLLENCEALAETEYEQASGRVAFG